MHFVVPEKVVPHFSFREGDRVGDFGAGSGYFLKALSGAVGRSGRVLAFEVQKNLAESLKGTVSAERLPNVEVMWSDIEKPSTRTSGGKLLDGGIMVNTLFQIEDKPQVFTEIHRLLEVGAVLSVIDWSDSFAGLGPRADAVVAPSTVRSVAEAHGFVFTGNFPAGDYHYGLLFRKR